MLKGIVKIDKIINKFLEPFECTARLSTDFGYYHTENLITYALVETEKGRASFMQSVERLKPTVTADVFLWSLLHEIGHHETMDYMTDKEEKLSNKIKEEVAQTKRPYADYYNAPDEKLATTWAVEYAETHTEELLTFWNKLQKAIMDFYKENNIKREEN